MTDPYHDHPAISASKLRDIKIPAIYYHKHILKDAPESEVTESMTRGNAFHCGFLEPAEFDNRYTVMPEGLNRRSKEGQQVYDAIMASGKQVLPAGDKATAGWPRIKAMIEAAHAHPISKLIFSCNPIIEQPVFWTDAHTGMECRGKPDILIPPCESFPRGLIVDPKSCDDADTGFFRSVANLEMHIQAAMYTDYFIDRYRCTPDFVWFAQEFSWPYLNKYIVAPQSLIEAGRDLYCERILTLIDCLESKEWPGYSQAMSVLDVPAWFLAVDESIESINYVEEN